MLRTEKSFLASFELLSELASEVTKACTHTKIASPKLREISGVVFNGHVVRFYTHVPLLGDDTLEALPLMLLCCSKPEATAADAYKAWLDQSALHPIVGTLVLEWTGDRNDSRCPDLFFINVLLMSLFLPPLLLKHGLAMLHSAAVDAGILNHGIKYKYSMETGFVAQPGALIHQGRQVMDMTPAELAALPPSVLEQALSNVQFEQATLLQQQGMLEAIMEADEDDAFWPLLEGTDESAGCEQSPLSTPSTSADAGTIPAKSQPAQGVRKRRRSRMSCSSPVQPHARDDDSHNEERDSYGGRPGPQQRVSSWSAAPVTSSSGGGNSGGGGGSTAAHSDTRSRPGGGDKQKPWAHGSCSDPYTLQFAAPVLEHNFMRYKTATMRHNEPYVYVTAAIIGLALIASPEDRLNPVCMRCLQMGALLRGLRMALYALPLQRMLPHLDAMERIWYVRETVDFLLHVGIAVLLIPRYIREVMGILPLGLHTILMVISMPIYLYFMSTQSFVAMRFVWSRWLVGSMCVAFAISSVAMPVMERWPFSLSMRIACVGGCWVLQGAASTLAVRKLRTVEQSARHDLAALVGQHAGM